MERASGGAGPQYRRHRGKLELVAAALEGELAALPVAVADTGNLRDDLLALAQQIATALTARRARLFVGIVLAGRDNPVPLNLLAGELRRIGATGWGDIIARTSERGEVAGSPVVPSVVADLPFAYIVGRTLLDGQPPGKGDLEAMIDTMILPALLSLDIRKRAISHT
ncbi:TetR-like C-terminal domain-containing protein [Paraburkholderia sp. 40]|uniref:TetR-like C-terminal domain-containing protein n=1 Tax=Paraburkholderia sp. 40 TaxID=2991059 RepID=UPI003D1ADBEC